MNELLDKIERIDQGVDRLIADRKLLVRALDVMIRAANQKEIDPLVMFASIEQARSVLEQVGRP